MPLYRQLAARSRSHAGCALGGDRLAMSVCGQTPFRDRLSVTADGRLQTDFSRHRPLVFSARASVSSVFSVSAHHPTRQVCSQLAHTSAPAANLRGPHIPPMLILQKIFLQSMLLHAKLQWFVVHVKIH